MFTLKVSFLERVDDDGPGQTSPRRRGDDEVWRKRERTLWLSDIRSVERIDSGLYATTAEVLDRHGEDVSIYADLFQGDAAEAAVSPLPQHALVLLLVYRGDGNDDYRFMLVERAWLLNETGATIDRLAP